MDPYLDSLYYPYKVTKLWQQIPGDSGFFEVGFDITKNVLTNAEKQVFNTWEINMSKSAAPQKVNSRSSSPCPLQVHTALDASSLKELEDGE
jgi:hypothetical protein